MPFVGSIIPRAIANLDPRVRRAKREDEARRETNAAGFRRALDEAELTAVERGEQAQHAYSNKAANSEVAAEEHRKLGYADLLNPANRRRQPKRPPRLDLSG